MNERKHKIIFASIVVVLVIGVALFIKSGDRTLHPNTVENLMTNVMLSTDTENYDECGRLFISREKYSREKYSYLREMFSKPWHNDKYNCEVVTGSNGKKWIILISPKKVDGFYKIIDVIPLSKEDE